MAAKCATGDIFIFQDCDYYPQDDVSYDFDEDVGIYPVRCVIFLDAQGKELDTSEIPGGYRNFRYDVGNHSGGVIIVKRQHFLQMNGLNPQYVGWGKEDDDFMMRFRYHKIPIRRNQYGTFLGLYHKDSAPPDSDVNLKKNIRLLSEFLDMCWVGYHHTTADVTEFQMDNWPNVRWLKMKNCSDDVKLASILIPTRKRPASLQATIDSINQTTKNKSAIEILVKVDSDDEETKEFSKVVKSEIDVRFVVGDRHPRGYFGMAQYHDALVQVSRGKLLLVFADDCIMKTQDWDAHLESYADKPCIIGVDNNDNEGAGFHVLLVISRVLYNIMQTFGAHPYFDRYLDKIKQKYPRISYSIKDIKTEHVKGQPNLSLGIAPPIFPGLNEDERKVFDNMVRRIDEYLSIKGLK
jgi:hypothetical protein